MLDSITKQFNIDATVFGQYSGIYHIGYCLMHLPIGILLDMYGPRKIMTLCTLLTVMGLLPLIFSNTTTHLIMGRFLIGMGSSAAILGVFKIIRLAFEERQFTKMLSLSVMIGLIGAIYGGGPVNYLCLTIGDDMVVKIFAVMGMVLATLCYAIVPDIKNEYQGSMLNGVKEVLSNYKVILSCIFAGFMVGPLEGFADVWGSKYLSVVYDYN